VLLRGSPLSPLVRKVRIALAEKDLSCETEPSACSASGIDDVPVLVLDAGRELARPGPICAFLERMRPEPTLYPADSMACARALFFEEWADTELAAAIRPILIGCDGEPGRLDLAFDFLEARLPAERTGVVGELSIADIALGAQLVSLARIGRIVDAHRWPRLAAYFERLQARPAFAESAEAGHDLRALPTRL
jgi:glutathione S-transferase